MNLNDMNVTDLRKLAAEYNVSGRSKMNKAALIDAIEAAWAQADSEAGELLDAVLGPETDTQEGMAAYVAEELRNVRVEFEMTTARSALANMSTTLEGVMRSSMAVRKGRIWELTDHLGGVLIVVKARTLDKLAKRWARKMERWAIDVRTVREF